MYGREDGDGPYNDCLKRFQLSLVQSVPTTMLQTVSFRTE